MRFILSSIAVLSLSVPSVLGLGQLGFDLGVKSNSNNGQCKTTADFESDFDNLKSYGTIVKLYAASDCNTLENIYPALASKNFQAVVGIWPTDDAHFALEQQALSTYLPKMSVDNVKAFTVGSEALYRKDLTAAQLSDAITTVKKLVSNIKDKDGNSYASIPVGTVDSWNVLIDGANAQVIQTADIVMSNAFSYWQGQVMANASYSFFDDIMQALQVIQTEKGGDIEFWVGETGWPTDGANFESAEPSVSNAEQFWKQAICGIRAWGINTFVFEAFDETWKPATAGTDGVEQHWGVLDGNGKPKFDTTCDFGN